MNKISPSRSDFVAERWGQRSLRYHFKLVDKSEVERKKGAVSCNFETAPLFLGLVLIMDTDVSAPRIL